MTQPLPLGLMEITGWWSRPEPIIMLPVIIASICGHPLSGTTATAGASTVPAASLTHCSKCTFTKQAMVDETAPIGGIPTVVGSACHHALSGIDTPIGSTTTLAAVTALCNTCTTFESIASETSIHYTSWQRAESEGAFKADRRRLARLYARSRVIYEQFARFHQRHSDPALPIVNRRGVPLPPSLADASTPTAKPRRTPATPNRVRFNESQTHPSRETARGQKQYWHEFSACKPGRYAPAEGGDGEDTSSPVLYKWNVSSLNDAYMRPFGFEDQDWWHLDATQAERGEWPSDMAQGEVEDDQGEDTGDEDWLPEPRQMGSDEEPVLGGDLEDSELN